MNVSLNNLEKSQVELNIVILPEEMKSDLEQAAKRLSKKIKIKGFRPGYAPYEVVRKEFGEAAIYEEAADSIVGYSYTKAVKENNLETVGQPRIEVTKLAPGNPLEYKATVALLPEITLPSWKKIKVEKKKIVVDDEKVDKAVRELSKMQIKEKLVERPAGDNDKVIIDMDMYLDKVPVEGGQAKGHAIFLREPYFIPGFKEKIIGQKKGETREFNLTFPDKHFQKNLAGKDVEFRVKVNDVYELEYPEINDEFARGLGQQSLADLKRLMNENIVKEEESREEQRSEGEMLDKLVKESKIGEIPPVLLESEVEKMIIELRENLSREGMEFDEYVKNILKKSPDELKKEFLPQAESRVKTALVIREIAKEENIRVEEKEIDEETEKMVSLYADTPAIKDNLKTASGREYLAYLIRNRKVINLLKKEIIKETK